MREGSIGYDLKPRVEKYVCIDWRSHFVTNIPTALVEKIDDENVDFPFGFF